MYTCAFDLQRLNYLIDWSVLSRSRGVSMFFGATSQSGAVVSLHTTRSAYLVAIVARVALATDVSFRSAHHKLKFTARGL